MTMEVCILSFSTFALLTIRIETSKEQLFDIITAILFFIVAAIEIFAFSVAMVVSTIHTGSVYQTH
jgi:hypothetical protein